MDFLFTYVKVNKRHHEDYAEQDKRRRYDLSSHNLFSLLRGRLYCRKHRIPRKRAFCHIIILQIISAPALRMSSMFALWISSVCDEVHLSSTSVL